MTMLFTYVVIIFAISICPMTESSNTNGFTVDLIHRDSPQSPSYDSSLSHSQRLVHALRRSIHRTNRFKPTNTSAQLPHAELISGSGEYFMKYSIGTPPVPSLGIADTGSDVIWTQCKPCLECFKQKLPFFVPRKSSTYRRVSCKSSACGVIEKTTCNRSGRKCVFSESYGDGSSTEGEFATDTITFGRSSEGKVFSFDKIKLGCGFKNSGTFSGVESGIVGLGGGRASLVRQLGPLIEGKFSYCLVPLSSNSLNSSKLNFGANGVVSGQNVVSTPLVPKSPETYYYLTLEGISVANKRLEFYESDSLSDLRVKQEGNIIIDSGTTLTFLPVSFYNKVEKEVRKAVKQSPVQDPEGILDLCYSAREEEINYPDIFVHFKGAHVKLKPKNTFVSLHKNLTCLAFKPSFDLAIFGNLAQMNFLIGYDLTKRTVSFKPTDCSKP